MEQNDARKASGSSFVRPIWIILSTIGGMALLFLLIAVFLVVFVFSSVTSLFKDASSHSNHHASSLVSSNFSVPHSSAPYIAGIRLEGEINEQVADEIIEKLETAQSDKNAKGILLEVSSPGGSVVPSQEIYDQIGFTKKTKPVVVYVREMAASGAYYSSANATQIIANRGSLLGSIGVIMHGFEADKLIKFLKLNPVTLKTGELKDAGSPMRPMTQIDKKYLSTLLEKTREQFQYDIATARHLSPETLKLLSDGRVILGSDALKLNMIDSLGSQDFAFREVLRLSKAPNDTELFFYESIDPITKIFSQTLTSEVSHMLRSIVSQTVDLRPLEELK